MKKLFTQFYWWFWAGRNDGRRLEQGLQQRYYLDEVSRQAGSRVSTRRTLQW